MEVSVIANNVEVLTGTMGLCHAVSRTGGVGVCQN